MIADINYWLAVAAEDIRRDKVDAEYEEELKELELQKQYEFMSYADECANDDAQYYYGEK
jgi:hypothetical protein